MNKIYVFAAYKYGTGDVGLVAVAEDGQQVAGHVSSSVDWGKRDMGLTPSCNWKHDLYAKKYPNGYELEWVDDWRAHPFLRGLMK